MADINYHSGLKFTDHRIDMLHADFSGMKDLEKVINDVLKRLAAREEVNSNVNLVQRGAYSREQFDFWFAELVRKELGKTLGIMRNKAKQKAEAAGAGSASSAVLRHQTKDGSRGYIGINDPHRRITNRTRIVPEPTGGETGIRRKRYVSERTKKLREYFGPDRSFILRFLEGGVPDKRTAKTFGPTGRGSRATYGNRGSIAARSFFNTMKSDMDMAAQQLGTTLTGKVKEWIEQQFKEE